MNLKNKRVWITGASAGLGAALAQEASRQGAHVILSARREEKLAAVAKTLAGPSTIIPLDLTQPETFAAAAAKAGEVDYLINNGGISQRSNAADTSQEVVRHIMETNFFGHVEMTRNVLPGMLQRRFGHIIAMSSVVGYFGTPKRSTYAASKHALHGYFDSLRFEVEDEGVQVTLICPGFIHTDISVNAVTADGSKQGTMDDGQAAGMPPEVFAQKAWKGILKGKRELYIGGTELTGIYLKRFVPSIFRKVIKKRDVT
ncbi:MAG: SDR family oxidoreductase [Saprospiraceae bacterium]